MEKRKIFREGEFYIIERNGRYYVHGMWGGKRIRRACKTHRLDWAQRFLFNLKREYDTSFKDEYNDPNKDWKVVAEFAWKRSMLSAGHRSIPFDITPADIFHLMKETEFRCAVSGIPLAKRVMADGSRDPWAPSMDRIQSCQGYTFDNIRVVCLAANYAMNQWGIDVLLRLAKGVISSSATVSQEEAPPAKTDTRLTQSVSKTAQVIEFVNEIQLPSPHIGFYGYHAIIDK
jgi:hypothetical protein